jgi:hypothetical protein
MLLLNQGDVRITAENDVEQLDYSEISYIPFDSTEQNPQITTVTYEKG